jgi:hypothetical protein
VECLSWLLSWQLLSFVEKSIVARSILTVTLRETVMTATNYFLLQFIYDMPESTVIVWLIPLALFNLIQAIINIIPAYLIYLRISKPKKIEDVTTGISQSKTTLISRILKRT